MSDDIRVPRAFTSFCSEPLGGGGRNAPANLSDENIERVIHALCTSTIDCRSRVGFGDPSDYVDLGDLIRDMYEERKRLLAAPQTAQADSAQEAAAYCKFVGGRWHYVTDCRHSPDGWEPLYRHPPQPVTPVEAKE